MANDRYNEHLALAVRLLKQAAGEVEAARKARVVRVVHAGDWQPPETPVHVCHDGCQAATDDQPGHLGVAAPVPAGGHR